MDLLTGVKNFLGRLVASAFVYPTGVFALKTGRWDRARSRLAWVIRNHSRHFSAHVHLGCMFLRHGNQLEALRLLNQARWINPFRFERLPLPPDIHAAIGRDPLFRTHDVSGGSADGRAWQSISGSAWKSDTREEGRSRYCGDRRSEIKAFRYRDFTCMEEYLRFRELPPISLEEISAVDWDRLLTLLHRDWQ